ncbi:MULTISPECIES: HAD family hydrolase [unclassified Spirosoma]|uniref:D-glycero-alpha-D-manno-heptose-1,7-bisphosphate 7-phosphatase n=1 Tax=unclassified Spirosoma TaxID=2621999 RepID=UPI00095C7CCD|nr:MULTISPECIES: HAD family hydrolase [unclassified Spirosoma]MBN8825079.1 HAD family hydrolase [Spirosoma sp.]OJW73366.1 MAG: D,D-heptose 1,7-bisphosphate phosphatase [Spirosoma sp. 48-14]
MNKCIFLDRDGVLNEDRTDYVYRVEDFIIPDGVPEALRLLKEAGYLLIVITNQAGIAKGLYTRDDVMTCYNYLQDQCGKLIDDIYYCPHHPKYDSESLTRKPGSLLLEKAIAKYNIRPDASWMIGDAPRDMQAGKRVGVRTIRIATEAQPSPDADGYATNLLEASRFVLEFAA